MFTWFRSKECHVSPAIMTGNRAPVSIILPFLKCMMHMTILVSWLYYNLSPSKRQYLLLAVIRNWVPIIATSIDGRRAKARWCLNRILSSSLLLFNSAAVYFSRQKVAGWESQIYGLVYSCCQDQILLIFKKIQNPD